MLSQFPNCSILFSVNGSDRPFGVGIETAGDVTIALIEHNTVNNGLVSPTPTPLLVLPVPSALNGSMVSALTLFIRTTMNKQLRKGGSNALNVHTVAFRQGRQ